jgi:hypothetical protein
MLGILGEHTHNDRAKKLLTRFINVMADITNNLDPQEISTPIQRGLAALSKLNIQEAQDLNGVNGIGKKDSEDVAAIITPSSSEDHERSPYSVLVCCYNVQYYPMRIVTDSDNEQNHILWGPQQEDHIHIV